MFTILICKKKQLTLHENQGSTKYDINKATIIENSVIDEFPAVNIRPGFFNLITCSRVESMWNMKNSKTNKDINKKKK